MDNTMVMNGTNITANRTTVRDVAVAAKYNDEVLTMNTILTFLGVLGIVGNLTVCFVILRVKKHRTMTNIFIFNQSLIDLTSSILVIAQTVGPTKYDVIVPRGIRGSILCKIWLSRYLMWSTFNVSTFNLIGLSLERYMAIVFPITYRKNFSAIKVKCACILIWAMGFAYQSYWAKANYNKNNGTCGVHYPEGYAQKVIGLVVFFVEYLLPILIMAFSYVSMFLVLKRRLVTTLGAVAHTTAPQSNGINTSIQITSQQESPVQVRARKNVVKMLAIVCITYATCWGPNQVMYFDYNILGHSHSRILINSTIVMAFCNMCVNPIIYALKYEQFRSGVRNACSCRNKVANDDTINVALATGINARSTSSRQPSDRETPSNSTRQFLAP
ncbi:galanin receptor 2a-like [Glandiceps talaboti]